MVAAPETQNAAAQAASATSALSTGKQQLVNGVHQGDHETKEQQGAQEQVESQATGGDNGVNDLTVVDSSAAPADRSAQESSQRSHMSNFDPTPAATTNLPPPDIARLIPCRFFPLGTCRYGDKCAFSHGVAGVAGSPGVPSTAELAPGAEQQQQQQQQQQEVPQQHQQQQQQYMQQHEGYGQGMPMYYPGMEHGGIEFGYQGVFPPQQGGYYPFPPHFQHQHYQHYQQGPPPQAYYQQGPPPPQHAPQLIAENIAPAASPSPVPSDHAQQPSSNSPEGQSALSPSTAAAPPFPSPSAGQQIPLQGYAPYAPYPGQAELGFAAHAAPTSPTAAFGADGLPLPAQRTPSLHTFFQTGAPSASVAGQAQPNGVPGAFPKGGPRPPAAARRPGPPMGMPFRNSLKPRYAPGTPKPACSFFESNRCKNRDSCPFQHLLPDGTDARDLRQGMAGVDGRTDNLEERGGLPPAWIANPRKGFKPHQHQHQQGQQPNFNGGYSVREPRPRNRFEEEQQRMRFEAQAQAQVQQQQQQQQPAEGGEATEGEGDKSEGSSAPRAQSETRQPFNGQMNGRLPPGGAPQLVAAINGLTRGIRPASQSPNGTGPAPSTPSVPQQPQQAQRVPSGADFPALSSAPLSPALEKSRPASPSPEAASAAPAVESTPSPGPVAPEASSGVPAPSPAVEASESSESEFVMINHSDATPPAAATVAPTSTPAPAPAPAPVPRIMGSFASAAARGASVVLPEKPKKVLIPPPAKAAPAVADESKEVTKESAVKKEGAKKAGGNKGAKRAPVASAAVKASA